MKTFLFLALVAMATAASSALAQPALFLNEYNCVKDNEHLSGADPAFGNGSTGVNGNGGNWIELVVGVDDTTINDWKCHWQNTDGTGNTEGYIYFDSDAAIWQGLQAGTIITIMEANSGLTQGPTGSTGLYRTSNISYDPGGGDWWIHVALDDDRYVSHGPAGFKVDNDDWRMEILDDGNNVVQSWVGESISGYVGSGISKTEIGKLEADPEDVAIGLYDDGDNSTFGAPNTWGTGSQDFTFLRTH